MSYQPVVLAVLGLLLLTCEIVSVIRDQRAGLAVPRSLKLWGIALAIASLWLFYPVNEKFRIFGIPFMAAVFERQEHGWTCYAGPLTAPTMLANAITALLLPRVLVKMRGGREPMLKSAAK